MGCADAEFVEKAADHVGEVAEWVGLVDAFGRAAIAGHVGHDHPEMLCERVDVAGVVGDAGGARPAAVQHDDRRSVPASATKIGLPATVTVCSVKVVVLMRWPRFWSNAESI